MHYAKSSLVNAVTVITLVLAGPTAAHDELYYSAANCKPIHAGHWEGSGAEGFEWSAGAWFNYDRDDSQILVCPIPYRRNTNNLERIVVLAVVNDRHHAQFTSATLCHQNSSTNLIFCDSDTDFPSQFGTSTIELAIQPTSGTRFVFLEVHVPDDDDDNNPFTLNGTSSFIGYRVLRN